jgi:hypothetical protein
MSIISAFCNITFSGLKILGKPETPVFTVNYCCGKNSMPKQYSWVTVAGTLKGTGSNSFLYRKLQGTLGEIEYTSVRAALVSVSSIEIPKHKLW